MNDAVVERREVPGQLEDARRAHRVSDETLRIINIRLFRRAEDVAQRFDFDNVAGVRRGRVRVDDIDFLRRQSGSRQRLRNALRLTLGVRENEVGRVAVHRVSDDFAVNFRAPFFRVREAFENVNATAFRDDDAVAVDVERSRRFRRIVVFRERVLSVERGENPERMDTFRNAPRQRDVDFAESELLDALNNPGVPRSAGGPERVVRPGDSVPKRNFARRVVRDGARVVVVRPIRAIVIVLLNLVNFVFRLDVAVFGNADVNADRVFADVFPIEPGVGDRLPDAVNREAPGAGASAQFAARLPFQHVAVANAGDRRAEITDFVRDDAADAVQNRAAVLGQIRPVRRRQPDAGDHDAFLFAHCQLPSFRYFPLFIFLTRFNRSNAVELKRPLFGVANRHIKFGSTSRRPERQSSNFNASSRATVFSYSARPMMHASIFASQSFLTSSIFEIPPDATT